MRQPFSTNQEWVQANSPLGSIGTKSVDDLWRYAYRMNVEPRMSKPADIINKAPHYNQGSIECIEAIRAALSPEEYIGFLKGQMLKYVWRLNHKGDPLENAKKARYYQDRFIELFEEPSNV